MTRVYLGLGGNVGDRQGNLERAVTLLKDVSRVIAVSPLYETAPVGFADQPTFLNAALDIETSLTPRELLAELQQIESALGKATPFKDGPRTIDLDILLFGDAVIDEPELRVPHPRMHERRFVLVPLADIAPDAVHPAFGRTIRELLNALPADDDVRPWQGASIVFPHPAG